ncbi:MAG: 5-bromo-4-chloroindolyl phosphate hydrolysis family protein [Paracoccaceae bacterium]
MAERYGGPFSPGAAKEPDALAATRTRTATRRAALLAAAALPFAWSALAGPPAHLPHDLAAAAVLLAAAWLTGEGERAAAAYDARPAARRPAIPRKLFATALTALGLFLGTLGHAGGLPATIALALAGGLLHLLAFGADPLRDKGAEGIDPFERDRVARVVDEAEARLSEMRAAVGRAGDPALIARVKRFSDAARRMCRTVEEDPRDLTAARRFLVVYVTGARDAAKKFADLWARAQDPKARTDFETLLGELETTFAARTTALLEDNRTDLDIEIGVLRDRLRREGLVQDQ